MWHIEHFEMENIETFIRILNRSYLFYLSPLYKTYVLQR